MAISDYAPVGFYSDEDELLRQNGGYAPVAPPPPGPSQQTEGFASLDVAPNPSSKGGQGSENGGYAPVASPPPDTSPATAAPAVDASNQPRARLDLEGNVIPIPSAPQAPALTGYAPVTPASGSVEDMEAHDPRSRFQYAPVGSPNAAAENPRPQWSEYQPPEPHGWAKFGHALAAVNPITNQIFNRGPEQRAERDYKNATAEYEAPTAQRDVEAQTEQRETQAELEHAQADTLRKTGGVKGEAEQPLKNSSQMNQALTRRFQVLHPGQALPPEYTLPPNATNGDYSRINESLKNEETAVGAKQTHESADADRKEARASREQDRKQNRDDKLSHQAEQDAAKHQKDRDAFVQPLQGAIDNADYQKEYAKSGTHTGTGDYQMMLQLQETIVAGQKAGIRFNTAEQARIEHAQSLMNSMRAKWGHVTGGTYFSDDQRHEIADAMESVALIHKQAIDRWDREHPGAQQPGSATRAGGGAESKGASAGAEAGAVEYKPGLVRNGYKFKGGDPTDKKNWEKQSQ